MRKMFLFIALALCSTTAAHAENNLLPSEFTVLVNHALVAEPGVDRRSVTGPLVDRVVSENLSEIERFLKGEVHFLHLEPEPARDAFWEFRDRDDDLGRVAWQRLMVIRINAFQMVDELLQNDIPQYNERFGPRPDDRYGISFPVQRTAQVLAQQGKADTALDLIAEHVRQHDSFDAPYSAYALPGQFMEVAAENGRTRQFRELNAWVLNGLNRAVEQRLKDTPEEGPKASKIPGEIFFSLFADRKLDGYEWTAEFMKLRDQVAAGKANARGRPGR